MCICIYFRILSTLAIKEKLQNYPLPPLPPQPLVWAMVYTYIAVVRVRGSADCEGRRGLQLCDLLKGTVQRKLTGVESDINRKVFLSH